MAKLLKADGAEQEVYPADGKKFTLSELRALCGGTVDIQMKPQWGRGARQVIVVNDNGKLCGLPVNARASELWRKWYPIARYPHNNDGILVGDVLVCGWNQIR